MITVTEPFLDDEEIKVLTNVIKSKDLSIGKYVELFEKAFAEYIGSKYAVSCTNGTTALHLALKACDINFYDNIILPNYTFVATAEAAKYCTNSLTFVEPDSTWNMDPSKIELKDNTRAIIPVHLYGNPCHMKDIMKIKENNPDIYIIEDACEALGAKYDGKHVGTIGDIGVFSFYGNKMITTGEGGMCVTDDEELYKRMLKLRHHGESDERYYHDELGYNYRMSNINAALGYTQLKKINKILELKDKIKDVYDISFKKNNKIKLQESYKNTEPVNWLYSIELKSVDTCKKIIDKLKENDIDTRTMFRPMDTMPPYDNKKLSKYDLSLRVINLPSSPTLEIYDQLKVMRIIEEVLENE